MTTTAEALDLPFDEAISFFRQKTNTPTRTWTDVYGAAHSHAFMVAGAASDALLTDFKAEILKALEQGTTLAEFRKGFDGIVHKHGWEYKGKRGWRSRLIFETNLRTAYAAGRWTQQTKPETLEAFPFLQYNHSGSKHPRKEHLAWDGLVIAANDPFWKTNYPPNGWSCGCFAISVSRGGLGRMGKSGPDEAPDLLFRAEEVGGETKRVPMGVDPGFEYNPGAAWLKQTAPGPVPLAAAPELVVAFVRRALETREAGRGWIPVGTAPDDLATALDVAIGTEVRLSADTIVQHADKHPEATPEAYAALASRLVKTGRLFRDVREGRQTEAIGFVEDDEGRLWKAAIKRTAAGELYQTTLHRSNPKQLRRMMRDGEEIRN